MMEGQVKPNCEGPCAASVGGINAVVTDLQESIASLKSRLTYGLKLSHPSPMANSVDKKPEMTSPLRDSLDCVRADLVELVKEVNDLRDRVDL